MFVYEVMCVTGRSQPWVLFLNLVFEAGSLLFATGLHTPGRLAHELTGASPVSTSHLEARELELQPCAKTQVQGQGSNASARFASRCHLPSPVVS